MKQITENSNVLHGHDRGFCRNKFALGAPKRALAGVILALCGLLAAPAWAQTVTLTPSAPQNYWIGVGTTNYSYTGANSNGIAVSETDGGATTNINLSLVGVDGITLFGDLTPSTLSSNGTAALSIWATNAAAGYYPLTVNASGDAIASTSFNLFVVPEWAQTNSGSTGNWSDDSMWSGGAAPLATDGVYIEHSFTGPWTNVVDGSRSIQSLVYLGAGGDEGGNVANGVHTVIAAGQTLSVLGTNGFSIGNYKADNVRPAYAFEGETLLVSNTAANFSIIASHPANDSKYIRADMSGLNNLKVDVDKVSISDVTAIKDGRDLTSIVDFVLAKTNVITATWSDDYNKPSFDTAVTYMRETEANNNNNSQSGNAQFRLGALTQIYADSVGIGLGNVNSSSSMKFDMSTGYRMVFASVNDAAPTSSVVFRNADGVSRMSLLALGVDTGLGKAGVSNRGNMDLHGGKVDMLVDQIWLGQCRTNITGDAGGKESSGGLWFDWGTVDCNTLIAGNMKYTNNVSALIGMVRVGTNGTLVVNDGLVLGKTPADVTGFESQAGKVSGQLEIDNGGTIRASQISVGKYSGNNVITVNSGGALEVTNTVASATTALGTLMVSAGGHLVLHKNGSSTLVYVTNLVASSGVIDVASVAGSGSFAPIISYAPGYGESASFVAGNVPEGYSATIFNNTTTHSIDLTLTAGSPKNLLWQGYVDNTWDNSTKNWLDLDTGVHTNFTTGDSVVFDDTATHFNINVSEDVVPRQAAGINGITMTNNLNAYTFSGTGGIRGAAAFAKYGTNSVEIDNYSEIAVAVNEGLFLENGTIGAAVIAAGAACSCGGTVLGGIDNFGVMTNSGTISGSFTAESGSTINYNYGSVNGSLTMQTGALLYNSGTFSAIGAATVPTNSVFYNAGTIYGTSLTVNGTLTDVVAGSPGSSPGSINIGNLMINGAFNPGGDGIATTKVTDYDINGNQLFDPNGRVQLNAGSMITFRVNSTNSQPYTKLLSRSQVFGPSQNFKAINGCTIIITNVGPAPFADGQTFKLFGQYYTDGNIGNAGLNTTNSYPVIQPSVPGPGLAWDLSQLYPNGIIGVANAAALQVALTNAAFVINDGSNVVSHLSWPADKVGGWVQQLNATLTNGLTATNWFTPNGGYLTNLSTVSDIYITNTLEADPTKPGSAVFFRFVYP